MTEQRLYWEQMADGGARLLRVYGRNGVAALPERIAGRPLTELGSYCFAPKPRLPERYEVAFVPEKEETGGETLTELAAGNVEQVALPGTVRRIGDLAFYHCTSLRFLEFGQALSEIGSDAFMNCRSLHQIRLRGDAPGSYQNCGGVRRILAQIASDMEVTFAYGSEPEAVLLFPEYFESYDEVAPAHLFGRNIEGEGFRARQSFSDGAVDFVQYDRIFPKACAEESERTLCRLAENRLRYPVDLKQEARERYEEYLRMHVQVLCEWALQERALERILFLGEAGFATREVWRSCIRRASELGWAEGAAQLLGMTEMYFPQEKKERYSFDDF